MKKEDMYNSISDIRKEFLEEAEGYHATRIHWKRWIAAAACFVLLLCAALPMFPGKESVNPFVITAYAMETDGEVTGTPIEIDQSAPMTKIELPNGMGGFLFSVDLEDKNAESQMNPFVLVEGSRSQEIEYIINNYAEEKGKAYFYFVPDEEVDVNGSIIDVTCGYTTPEGSTVYYVLQIVKDNDKYTVTLISATSYPVYDPNLPVGENANLDGYTPPKAG